MIPQHWVATDRCGSGDTASRPRMKQRKIAYRCGGGLSGRRGVNQMDSGNANGWRQPRQNTTLMLRNLPLKIRRASRRAITRSPCVVWPLFRATFSVPSPPSCASRRPTVMNPCVVQATSAEQTQWSRLHRSRDSELVGPYLTGCALCMNQDETLVVFSLPSSLFAIIPQKNQPLRPEACLV